MSGEVELKGKEIIFSREECTRLYAISRGEKIFIVIELVSVILNKEPLNLVKTN